MVTGIIIVSHFAAISCVLVEILSHEVFDFAQTGVDYRIATTPEPLQERCISSVLRVYAKLEHLTSSDDSAVYEALAEATKIVLEKPCSPRV